jgi:multimeric flavodoxin WrbA
MYLAKPCYTCDMPAPGIKLKALVLNASLKHSRELSNTGELAELVMKNLKEFGVSSEIIRLADKKIAVGVKYRHGRDDEWPAIAKKIRETDILIMATPIWWGNRSSVMQRVIERLDAFDEEYIKEGRSALYNKVAGIVITGSEDGAQQTMGTIMLVLTWMGFTLPPECGAYWVGEVGQPVKNDRAKRLKNKATKQMAKNMARNIVYYAQLLKKEPLIPVK